MTAVRWSVLDSHLGVLIGGVSGETMERYRVGYVITLPHVPPLVKGEARGI